MPNAFRAPHEPVDPRAHRSPQADNPPIDRSIDPSARTSGHAAPGISTRQAAEARARERWSSVSDRNVRRLNVLAAVVGLILTSPLVAIIAVAVKLTSKGPILYRQNRVGHDRRRFGGPGSESGRRRADTGGRVFTIYKFRTMYVGQGDRQVWASADDPRVTPVGRILRRYRLDELPQFLNVVRGDMNIVGPRPEQPEIFQDLRQQVEGYQQRQTVLPGITGWAQVNHHYDQCLDDVRRKVGLDLEYIRRRSPAEDLRIMARTLPVMIRRKGSL